MRPTGSLFFRECDSIDNMKILHIVNDSLSDLSKQIIDIQSAGNEVKVIELSDENKSYEAIVDDIFAYDRVVSW